MASWFDSVGQSIGNFVSGRGFEDNSQRAVIDAQNEKKRREEQQRAINQPVVQQKTAPQPQLNNILSPVSFGDPLATNQIIKPVVKATPQVQAQPAKPNIFNRIINGVNNFTAQANDAFFRDNLIRGGANIVNSFATGFNQDETKKRTEEFLRSMYLSDKNGQSALARGTDKNSAAGRWGQAVGQTEGVATDFASMAIPGSAVDKAMRSVQLLQGTGKIAPVINSAIRILPGSLLSSSINASQQVGRGEKVNIPESLAIGTAADLGLPLAGKLLQKIPGVKNVGGMVNNLISKLLNKNKVAGDLIEQKLGLTVKDNVDTSFNKLEKAYEKGRITEEEYQAFNRYKKTGDIIAQKAKENTDKVVETAKQVPQSQLRPSTLLQSIEQTQSGSVPIVPKSLIKSSSPNIITPNDVAPSVRPTVDTPQVSKVEVPAITPEVTTPNNVLVSPNPTLTEISSIIENTKNPTMPKTPRSKLTPQNELPNIVQKQMDNFTGKLKVNKNGQIYQEVSHEANRNAALKNLLDNKTPEEYLANAAKTGQADNAELAILMDQVPKNSPVWGELASLKGKLSTQKGQALALLERTMRETATADQLTSRTLQKANMAGFDTDQIAAPIEQINKNFTDARDAYNALLQTKHTSKELRDAKNALDFESRKSFIDTEKLLDSVAKGKEQHDLALEIGQKANLYTLTSAGSSLLSSPATFIKNTYQGFTSPAYQATTGSLEGKISQQIGGTRIGTFDTKGFKQGLKQGYSEWKANNILRKNQLGLTKNFEVTHPIKSIRNIVGVTTDFGNIGMEAGAQAGMRSHYAKLLQDQGLTGEKLIKAVDDAVTQDKLNLHDVYIKDMNDLNGLTSNTGRNDQVASVRKTLSKWVEQTGVTKKTANTVADYIEKAIVPFVKPATVIGKKGINMATGGLSDNLIPLIQASRRGDAAAVKNAISKILSTTATTTAGVTAIGYGLHKSGVLKQDEYGGWEIENIPLSGYAGAYVVPLATGALIAQSKMVL